MTAVVTGAGGRTGLLAVKKLLADSSQFETRAVVRDDKASPTASLCLPFVPAGAGFSMLRDRRWWGGGAPPPPAIPARQPATPSDDAARVPIYAA